MARHRPRAPQWLRSIRRRPAAALTLAVLAGLATLAAASAPLLDRAVEQGVLVKALQGSTLQQRTVTGLVQTGPDSDPATSLKIATLAPAAVRHPEVWRPAVTILAESGTDDPLSWGSGGAVRERLTGTVGCTGVRLTAGRCVAATGEALLPAETARRTGVGVGGRIGLQAEGADGPLTMRIVGIYDPTSGTGALLAAPERLVGATTKVTDPNLVVTRSQLLVPFREIFVGTAAYGVRELRTDVPITELPLVRDDIARIERTELGSAAATAGLDISTELVGLLDAVDAERGAAAIVLAVVTLQALLLAWFALGIVVARMARARAAEWGLVRLRGIPRRRRLAMSATEPAVALVVGAAAGLGLAALIGRPIARAAVGVTVPVLPPEALLAAAVAFVGSLVALAAALVRAARIPLPTLLRRTTEPRRLTRVALIGEAIVFVATAAAVQALVTRSGVVGDRVALLAPGLIALTIGLVAVLAGTRLVRRSTRRAPSSLAGLVLGRGLARTPSQLTAAVMVTVGVSLAVLVLQASSQADRTADIAALSKAGAPVVLHVRTPRTLSVLDAVQRADPAGRSAMAVEELTTGENVGRVVAVDSSRLGAVSTWSTAWAGTTPARLHAALSPAVGRSLEIRGTRLTLALRGLALPDLTPTSPFAVVVTMQNDDQLQEIQLPVITTGTPIGTGGTLTLRQAIPCSAGCRMVSIGMIDDAPSDFLGPWSARMTVAALSTDAEPAADLAPWLTTPGRWAVAINHVADSTQPVKTTLSTTSGGLAMTMQDLDGGLQPAIRIADTTQPLPALAAAGTKRLDFAGIPGAFFGTALDNSGILERVVGTTPALPRSMGTGVLVDLRQALPQADTASTLIDREVWTTTAAAAGVRRSLAAQGVTVTRTETLAGWTTQYEQQAGPVSARLAQLSGVCALLLVLVAVIGLRLVGGGARRREWRSYLDGGVSAGRLRRLVALEFLIPAASGCLLGAGAGLVAFAVAGAHLPLFDTSGGVPPIPGSPPWSLLAIVLLVVGLLAAISVPIAALETAEEAR